MQGWPYAPFSVFCESVSALQSPSNRWSDEVDNIAVLQQLLMYGAALSIG